MKNLARTGYDFIDILNISINNLFIDILCMSLFAEDKIIKKIYRSALRHKISHFFHS